VLHLNAATPEYLDLRVPEPDFNDSAGQHPLEVARLLGELVRSPIFPRTP
jgi:hypothetical protein